MADDAARVEQLEAELRRVRDLHAVEVAALRHDLEQRDGVLAEALEQQAATAEVLRVIAASPGQALRTTLVDLQVRAKQLLDAAGGAIFRVDGDILRRVTSHEAGETDDGWTERPLDRRTISGRAVLDRRVQHIHDVTDSSEAGDVLPESRALRVRTGARTFLAAPLLRGDVAIGAIFVVRNEVRPFTDREIALLETFAAQAVVAMENARLFQALQESNRQIAEALEQQTATAEVLRVIASTPTDLDRVLQSIIETAARLCEAPSGALLHYRERDQHLAPRAGVGLAGERIKSRLPLNFETSPGVPATRTSAPGHAFVEGRTIHVLDMAEAVRSEYPDSQAVHANLGYRTVVYVPLLRHGMPIGVLSMQRFEVRPYTEQQIRLLETFADQAVIAIENARLFQELQERTAQLTRSVDEQRALAEVSQTVSSSLDLQDVLTTIVAHATRLAGADAGTI